MGKSNKKSTGKKGNPKGNPQNLILWKPGQSGNPKGYPKGVKNRSTVAKKVLSMRGILPEEILGKIKEIFPDVNNEMDIEEIATIRQAGKAIVDGEVQSYNALMDSAYGKANQGITGPDGGAIVVAQDPALQDLLKMTPEQRKARLDELEAKKDASLKK